MRFAVLGPLAVWDDEGRPVKIVESKVRALLADLLVHEGRPVSADRLIDDLWGAEPPERAGNALQAKVSRLRAALGRDRVPYQAAGYRLRLEPSDEVDAARFRSLVAPAGPAAGPRERAALLTEALGLWRGPAFADVADEEFARGAARRLEEQRLSVLEEQAEARLAAGDHLLLAGELAGLVARHPLRERLRAVQLRALYVAGRQSEAIASYADLRDRLADELGVDPGPALTTLFEAILRQDPALLAGTPAPAESGTAPDGEARTNLPAPLGDLVGRDAATAEVRRLLRAGRLVTLTGPGGVGKTRLALEAARGAAASPEEGPAEEFGDGVWLVELAGWRGGADDLAQHVAAVLGLRDDATPASGADAAPVSGGDAAGGAAGARVAGALRRRELLLVLDNCEHVVEAAASLAGGLLAAAPRLRVLATGREPLDLAGERVFVVEPLPEADAVRLFVERAAASAPGFSPADDETRELVAAVCRRLDGLPLALELAATRVRGLGVRELAARLEDRFAVLTRGRRGAPERQRTLRAVIDWSWELLSTPERVVLRRLAVHRDGCTLEAAEEVCPGDGVAADEVLDLVTRLVDRSLAVMTDGPAGPRYGLLESVAAYARERLREADDLDETRERHLRYYTALAERAEPALRGAGQREWLARLDAESANLRAALEEAAGRGDAVLADRLGCALSWWWLLRGRLHEGRRSLARVCALAPGSAGARVAHAAFTLLTGGRPEPVPLGDLSSSGAAVPGRVVWLYAYALFNAGDLDTGALDLAAASEDPWTTAATLSLRAMHALLDGDLAAAARHARRGAELFRELGDRWGELQTVPPLSAVAEIRGDYAEAARLQEDGLRIAEDLGLANELSARRSGLGRLALLAHDWERARDLHERARDQAARHGHVYGEVHAVMGLALGARRSGDLDAAESHLVRLRDVHPSSPAGEHLVHAELGFVAELRGDHGSAADRHRRGLELARSAGEPRAVALSLEGLAGAAALAGDAGRAALLLGAADGLRGSVGAPLPAAERGDVERITASAVATLGQDAFAATFLQGVNNFVDIAENTETNFS
ncbi:BTAD domain-containing putative transcriptional regulator [Nonomuraea sp. NPDC049607]|uniref:BTAD domain-containing putative transcriptional regulator n=1 Tax=Nonomuraea sp. NPDC049607 TaxID=3154732 RepID=UPI003417542B